MTNSSRYEYEALRYAELPSIPSEAKENGPVWIFAIARTLSYNMSVGYAIVRNSYGDNPNVIKYFGDGGIAKITNIHPYKFLEQKYVPNISDLAGLRSFIAKVYGEDKDKVSKLKKDTLLRLMYNYCSKRQLADEDEARRLKEARDEADAIRAREEQIRNQDNQDNDE